MHLRLPALPVKFWLLLLATICSFGSASSSVQSAEFVRFRVKGLERTISVADLETFSNTGIPSRQLRWYLERLSSEQQALLRQALTAELEISAYTLLNMANSPLGDSFLRSLLPLFWGGVEDEQLLKALRASLILAADEGSLSAINVIRNYPLSNVRIDLNVVMAAVKDVRQMEADVDKLFAAIQGDSEFTTAEPAASSSAISNVPTTQVPTTQVLGPLQWHRRELTFQNPQRDSNERLVADVYLPHNVDSPAPLIVMSHGLANDRRSFVYLAEHLASHGFAVASIQHPDTDFPRLQRILRGEAEIPNADLFVDRPTDIFALLDAIEQKQMDGLRWSSQINTQSVGLFGQSLGGFTVLAAGGARFDFDHLESSCQMRFDNVIPLNVSSILQCQLLNLEGREQIATDERIAAVVALNSVGSALFGPSGMAEIQLPIALVASSHDLVAPAVEEQVRPFTWLESEDRHLMYVTPASHVSFVGSRSLNFEGIPPEWLGPDPEFAYPIMSWFVTSFFDTYINGTAEFESLRSGEHWPADTGAYDFALTRDFSAEDLEEAVGR